EIAKFVDVTYKVVGWEQIEVLGRRARVRKSLVSGLVPGLTHSEYRDSEGTVWKVDMGILQMEVLRATREQALQKPPAFEGFDALGDIMVRVKTRLARPREVRTALYRLRLKEGKASDLNLDGPGQKVERTADDGSVLLRVKSVRPDPEHVVPHPIRDPDMKKYLDPSTFVQSDDAEIVRVAREVASEVRSSYAAAKRLEQWVFRNVKEKNLDRAFASAKEVMQDRAGDCTEHAVLLAALLRAAGIPSRGASGILYFELPGAGPAFVYHMWTEGYVGDWVPLDATLAGSFVDATHIRLAESDLAAMSPAAGMLEIVQVFGRLNIEIVEYAAGERTVRPGGKKRRSFVETRYRDLDYGLSFAVPEGWDVLHAGDPGMVEKGAVTCLVRRGTKERIALFARDVAPGAILSEVIDRQTARFDVKKRKSAKLGGLAALELTYEKDGRPRQGVAAKREGTLYLLRLEPVTPAGSEALAEVAESFRFE
ncbi:MAG: transglutaminase-like domain-containing protein, partial [Planctomycetota bacterium]